MMNSGPGVSELIAISTDALGTSVSRLDDIRCDVYPELLNELKQMLADRNGFYAFESALHVFPVDGSPPHSGLKEWNSTNVWRFEYRDLAEGPLFFAEDVFGGQFCLLNGEVRSFDPETGEQAVLATSIDGWAKVVLADYAVLTGYPLAHEWQKANGPLSPGLRLVPKRPFVLGGEFEVSNLAAMDAALGMRSRGNLARQLRDLQDGTQVRYRVVD